MHRKGARLADTITLSFLLKQHVLFRKYSPQLVLNTLSCWSDSVVFHIKAIRFVGQKTRFFILKPSVLSVGKHGFSY